MSKTQEALKLALEALEHMCMHTRAKVGYRNKLIGEAMDKAREALAEQPRLLSAAPCDQCGYNGPGYYQPDTHPCAAKHHQALAEQPAQQHPDLSHLRPKTQEAIRGWIKDGTFFDRAIGTMHDQEKLLMAYEKAQQQEPVAWAIFTDAGNARMWSTFQPHLQKLADAEGLTITSLYTSPPASKPLTDEQIAHATAPVFMGGTPSLTGIARAIEAAHGIKGDA